MHKSKQKIRIGVHLNQLKNALKLQIHKTQNIETTQLS
jgi:hypothetical protein